MAKNDSKTGALLSAKQATNVEIVMQILSSLTREELINSDIADIEYVVMLVQCNQKGWEGPTFSELFPDKDISAFRNENGKALPGGRRFAKHNNADAVLKMQRHILRTQSLPACAQKMYDMLQSKYMRDTTLSMDRDRLETITNSLYNVVHNITVV